jgi:hypothetical protein
VRLAEAAVRSLSRADVVAEEGLAAYSIAGYHVVLDPSNGDVVSKRFVK